MANRKSMNGGRRMDHNRTNNFNRGGISPWQGGGGPTAGLPNLLPLGGNGTEALALANNLLNNLLQSRQNTVPSLLDMPIRRDFGPDMGRFNRGYVPNRIGNQGNFRRTGTYNRAGERINNNRKPFRPNDGPRNRQIFMKKDADKAKPVPKAESTDGTKDVSDATEKTDATKVEDAKEALKTSFDDINSQLLKCHICNKSMWDGRSFVNHLSGRAHAIMMQKTAESYALTADTMRQEFKIREIKRTRKSGHQPARDFYCAMCDMYAADGAIHRTTVGHRKLKKYLHPNCTSCHKEMPTRIELDEHRLTPEHLKNVQDKHEIVIKPKPEVMVLSTLSMEQSYVRDDRQRKRRHSYSEDNQEIINKDGEESKNDVDANDIEVKCDENEEPKKDVVDQDNTLIDYSEGDDLTNFTVTMLPLYNTERGVGRSFLTEFKCVQCKLCRKLLDTPETAEVHLRTWRHHQLFVKMLKEKTGNEGEGAKRSAAALEENDESGEPKRCRTTTDNDNDNDENNVEEDQDITLKEEDPSEADVECGDEDTNTESWEQTVDEILDDEKSNDQDMEDVEPVIEVQKEKSPSPTIKPKGTPRGRGRGRRAK